MHAVWYDLPDPVYGDHNRWRVPAPIAAVPQPPVPAPAPPPRPTPAAQQSSQPTSAGDLAGAGGALEAPVEAQLEAVVCAGLLQREDFNERIMAALRGMTVRRCSRSTPTPLSRRARVRMRVGPQGTSPLRFEPET